MNWFLKKKAISVKIITVIDERKTRGAEMPMQSMNLIAKVCTIVIAQVKWH